MIRLFSKLEPPSSIEDAYSRGRQQADRGKLDAALETLLGALLVTHARETPYAETVLLASQVLERFGDKRGALSAAWYAGDRARQNQLVHDVPPIDRARTFAAWAEKDPGSRAKLYSAAAAELERAGLLVRAAIYYERANDVAAARALWSRLAQLIDSDRGERYAAGLARYNLARTCRQANDARGAHEATIAAVHRLEEAADRYESMGQRERAFDCYHVLIDIGGFCKAFEHVLEGSVNAIRILSEDNLRYHALRLYEHSLRLAVDAGEHTAAATLAREMTEYARRQGLFRIATRGTLMQADLWSDVADRTQQRGGPTHLVENAMLASLLASAEAGQYTRVGDIYRKLQDLEIDDARRAHYGRASRRYVDAKNTPLDSTLKDERLGEHVGPPEVWYVDLLEWEERGNPAEACADVLLDPAEESERITRRAALVARIVALAAESAGRQDAVAAAGIVANYLAPIGLYGLLAPLEALYAHEDPGVRLATVRALSRYYYKRTFVTLEKAIADPDAGVVKEAVAAIERLRFDHAFDPLARIYRTASQSAARLAALRAIARIDALEAAELVLGVLEHGGPEEREAVSTALKAARGNRFLDVARAAYPDASQALKRSLGEVLRARGMPV